MRKLLSHLRKNINSIILVTFKVKLFVFLEIHILFIPVFIPDIIRLLFISHKKTLKQWFYFVFNANMSAVYHLLFFFFLNVYAMRTKEIILAEF